MRRDTHQREKTAHCAELSRCGMTAAFGPPVRPPGWRTGRVDEGVMQVSRPKPQRVGSLVEACSHVPCGTVAPLSSLGPGPPRQFSCHFSRSSVLCDNTQKKRGMPLPSLLHATDNRANAHGAGKPLWSRPMKRMLFNATQQEELRVAIVDGQKLIESTSKPPGANSVKAIFTRESLPASSPRSKPVS